MAVSIFTTQTPAITNGNDGVAYTLGTEFSRSTSGTITHGRWFFPSPIPTGTTDFVLYAGTGGAPIARASFVSPVAGAWNTVALTPPVAYTAGTTLVAAVRTSGMYVATGSFFTVDLVNGDITAPGATNGRLDAADQFPGNVSGSRACFFADVVLGGGATTHTGTASGSASSAGAAAVRLRLAATGSGGSTSSGAAGVALRLAVAGSGGSTSGGSAAATVTSAAVTHAATGSGAATSNGSAAAVSTLAATASGSASSAGSSAGTIHSGPLTLTGAAAGASGSSGAAAVTLTVTAAAAGTATTGGTATPALLLAALATAAAASAGQALARIIGESVKATSTPTVAGGTSTPTLTAAVTSTPVLTARRTSTSEVTHG